MVFDSFDIRFELQQQETPHERVVAACFLGVLFGLAVVRELLSE